MFKRILNGLLILTFNVSLLTPPPAQAQPAVLPNPGQMITLTKPHVPVSLKGILVHPDKPFSFDFIVDSGHTGLKGNGLSSESLKMAKYFLAALTVPEQDIWVNLSPYEKDRMIAKTFGETTMGQDLLAQDYILKQLTASLTFPEQSLGKKFWDKVFAQTQSKFGNVQVPVNTFNKVWVMPQAAQVYEHGNGAFVAEAKLKVMLEQDYLALKKNNVAGGPEEGSRWSAGNEHQRDTAGTGPAHAIASQVVREIIIPALEKEVNEGANFSELRQIYQAVILASWYKIRLKDSILTKAYANQNKVAGVVKDDKQANEKIYQQYLAAFKKGAYNFIREDVDAASQKKVARKYISGGAHIDPAQLVTRSLANQAEARKGSDLAQVGELNIVPLSVDDQAQMANNTPENKWRNENYRGPQKDKMNGMKQDDKGTAPVNSTNMVKGERDGRAARQSLEDGLSALKKGLIIAAIADGSADEAADRAADGAVDEAQLTINESAQKINGVIKQLKVSFANLLSNSQVETKLVVYLIMKDFSAKGQDDAVEEIALILGQENSGTIKTQIRGMIAGAVKLLKDKDAAMSSRVISENLHALIGQDKVVSNFLMAKIEEAKKYDPEYLPFLTASLERRTKIEQEIHRKQLSVQDLNIAMQQAVNGYVTMFGWDMSKVQVLNENVDLPRLIQEELEAGKVTGSFIQLEDGNYYARSNPKDVARNPAKTKVSSSDPKHRGLHNNWTEQDQLREKVIGLMKDEAKPADTVYVLPYLLGPIGSPHSKVGVQITTNRQVAIQIMTLYKVGMDAIRQLGDSDKFSKGVNVPGDLDQIFAENGERQNFVAFVENQEFLSIGSAYGGNAILPKKFELRQGMFNGVEGVLNNDEIAMSEHMFILSLRDKKTGKENVILGAFPANAGKTNMGMIEIPTMLKEKYEAQLGGDDLAKLFPAQNGDKVSKNLGGLRAINIEDGIFGVIYGTGEDTNPLLMKAIKPRTNIIFTNIAVNVITKQGWWEKKTKDYPAYDPTTARGWLDWKGDKIIDRVITQEDVNKVLGSGKMLETLSREEKWQVQARKDVWAHRNSRASIPITNVDNLSRDFYNPEGFPIVDMILFGGKNDFYPLLTVPYDVREGLYDGISEGAEGTAATVTGPSKTINPQPMAQADFMGHSEPHYMKAWFKVIELMGEANMPLLAHINQIKSDWPGYEFNVLLHDLLIRFKAGEKNLFRRTALGWIPRVEAFGDLKGVINPRTKKQITAEDLQGLLGYDPYYWLGQEMPRREAYLKQVNAASIEQVPDIVWEKHEALIKRLENEVAVDVLNEIQKKLEMPVLVDEDNQKGLLLFEGAEKIYPVTLERIGQLLLEAGLNETYAIKQGQRTDNDKKINQIFIIVKQGNPDPLKTAGALRAKLQYVTAKAILASTGETDAAQLTASELRNIIKRLRAVPEFALISQQSAVFETLQQHLSQRPSEIINDGFFLGNFRDWREGTIAAILAIPDLKTAMIGKKSEWITKRVSVLVTLANRLAVELLIAKYPDEGKDIVIKWWALLDGNVQSVQAEIGRLERSLAGVRAQLAGYPTGSDDARQAALIINLTENLLQVQEEKLKGLEAELDSMRKQKPTTSESEDELNLVKLLLGGVTEWADAAQLTAPQAEQIIAQLQADGAESKFLFEKNPTGVAQAVKDYLMTRPDSNYFPENGALSNAFNAAEKAILEASRLTNDARYNNAFLGSRIRAMLTKANELARPRIDAAQLADGQKADAAIQRVKANVGAFKSMSLDSVSRILKPYFMEPTTETAIAAMLALRRAKPNLSVRDANVAINAAKTILDKVMADAAMSTDETKIVDEKTLQAFRDGKITMETALQGIPKDKIEDAKKELRRAKGLPEPLTPFKADPAAGEYVDSAMTPGGIDLTKAGGLDVKIKRDAKGMPLPWNMQNVQQFQINGLTPQLRGPITTVNLPVLLGFDPAAKADKSA